MALLKAGNIEQEEEEEDEEGEGDNVQNQQLLDQEIEMYTNQLFNQSAVQIQKVWRGFYIRKLINEYFTMFES